MREKQQITELLVPKIKINIPEIYPLGTIAMVKDKEPDLEIKINKIFVVWDCIENKLVNIEYCQNRESFKPDELIFRENTMKTCLEFQIPKFSSCKILGKKGINEYTSRSRKALVVFSMTKRNPNHFRMVFNFPHNFPLLFNKSGDLIHDFGEKLIEIL